MRRRRRSLAERPRLFASYLEALRNSLGDAASIILFGGRAAVGPWRDEPRDYDLAIVVPDDVDPEEVEELARRLRPRGLPVDIIVLRLSQLRDPLIRQMLSRRLVLHDPLGVEELL